MASGEHPASRNLKPEVYLNLPENLESFTAFDMSVYLNQDENLESFTAVWLDADIVKDADYYNSTLISLRRFISCVKIFADPDSCIDYISSIENEKVFIVLSGFLGEVVVPLTYELPQIEFIYIFCHNKGKHEQWANNYCKIHGVFNDKNSLFFKMAEDVKAFSNDISSMTLLTKESSFQDRTTLYGGLFYPLVIEMLNDIPATDDAKNEMIKECRMYYKDNVKQQEEIDDFEKTYKADKAIWWYTKNTFVYRLLNKAFRTQNIGIMIKFRFILADINTQLSSLETNHMGPLYRSMIDTNKNILTVYRGQQLSVNELQQIKDRLNKRISMNTYLSATTDKYVALIFAGDGSQRPHFESVLFEINIDIRDRLLGRKCCKPLLFIDKLSEIPHEKEILFSLRTVFKVESIKQLDNGIWHIVLRLVKQKHQWNAVRRIFLKPKNLLPQVIKFFCRGVDDSLEKAYIATVIYELPANIRDTVTCYVALASVCSYAEDYRTQLKIYSEIIKLFHDALPPNHPFLSLCTMESMKRNREKPNYAKFHALMNSTLVAKLNAVNDKGEIIETVFEQEDPKTTFEDAFCRNSSDSDGSED
ncbi:unnamed protein product [Didymodactylos carnosus]|uniref:Uncharacterized protein n=1 Tax=Didymodactylos carnosus TaxID=1234261 RepID=A0A8S2E0D0_9BILA|nr:unnamed protein product [Didymodactylos carnosus]CAF3793209.1 unnamed protein product [Didymodactylos carnosus]